MRVRKLPSFTVILEELCPQESNNVKMFLFENMRNKYEESNKVVCYLLFKKLFKDEFNEICKEKDRDEEKE